MDWSSCRCHNLCNCHSSTAWLLLAAAPSVLGSRLLHSDCPASAPAAAAGVVDRHAESAGWKLIWLTGACSFADASFTPCSSGKAPKSCQPTAGVQLFSHASSSHTAFESTACQPCCVVLLTFRHCHTESSKSGQSAQTARSSPSCDSATAVKPKLAPVATVAWCCRSSVLYTWMAGW